MLCLCLLCANLPVFAPIGSAMAESASPVPTEVPAATAAPEATVSPENPYGEPGPRTAPDPSASVMQNNARAVSSFTLPPDISPATSSKGEPLIVVWQNVDVPRTFGEEGWNVPPTAGFIFRDLAYDRVQEPISLDVQITDSDGNVVPQITKKGTYTATIITPDTLSTSDGKPCWLDYSGY